MLIILLVFAAAMGLNFYFHIYRNSLVFNARNGLSLEEWYKLPDYNYMIYHFIKWSDRKLKLMALGIADGD